MNRPFEFLAGSAVGDITPSGVPFLFGYPHVRRCSSGVHDPLLSSALCLGDGHKKIVFLANDIIFVSKALAARVRRRIEEATAIPASAIMVSATHTHSGPVTVDCLSSAADPVVPKADPRYVQRLEDVLVATGTQAFRSVEPAQVGLAMADGTGLGTNRRSPSGPTDPQVPVLAARSANGDRLLAIMAVCSMHPTVLHEDSTLVSGDFLGLARLQLRHGPLGAACPVLFQTGPCGNLSPRRVVKANTFEEATLLGNRLGTAIEKAISGIRFLSEARVACCGDLVDLPRKAFPAVEEAEKKVTAAADRLARLRRNGSPREEVRTAECDWFGAEESLALARAFADGRLAEVYASCLPAEIQALSVGPWTFVGWPGEVFVEYAQAVKSRRTNTFVISLANGELQGYVVTPEAAEEGGYEASNGLFSPEAGRMLVERTVGLLEQAVPG